MAQMIADQDAEEGDPQTYAISGRALLINSLKATSCERGLLVNFGSSRLEYKRFILSSHQRKSATSADSPGSRE